MKPPPDEVQTSQRLWVGAIGLAAVVLLIAFAGWVIGSGERDGAGRNPEIAVNLLIDNAAAASEPLAEMGAAPGPGNGQAPVTR